MFFLFQKQRAAGGGSPAAPETASAVVTGAGTANVNDTYARTGEQGGKAYFLNGDASAEAAWDGSSWTINNGDGTMYASSGDDDVAYPWLVAVWDVIDGDSPAPTVTIG